MPHERHCSTRCVKSPIGKAIATVASSCTPASAMSQELPRFPLHLALANTLEICQRQDAAQHDRPKAHAALLIARQAVSKARRRSPSEAWTATAQIAPAKQPARRRRHATSARSKRRADANAEPLGACLPETGSRSRAPPRTRRSAVATQRRSRRRQERSDVAGVAVSDGAGIEAADPSGTQPRIHRPPLSILVRRNAAHAAS